MFRFLIKKALILFLSLFCVISGTFLIMKAIPGDPFMDERITPEALKALHAYYGLDEPLGVQYMKYLKGYATLDLGRSLVYTGRSVNQLISAGFPVSARLGLQALLFAIPAGIFLGSWAALRRSRWQDNLAMAISTVGISVPNFVMATLLQYFIALQLHLLPVARWGSFAHTILPTLALAFLPTAFIARLTRSNMVEILQQDFIRTARAKGLPPFRIAIVHGLRNALLPVISYLGPVSAQILTGSFVVERIFAIPGLGEWLIHSIYNRDYPVIMGITVFYSSLLLLFIFLADIAYSLLDPRIRAIHRRWDHG
jgi:oligopeptide transport system permease protein